MTFLNEGSTEGQTTQQTTQQNSGGGGAKTQQGTGGTQPSWRDTLPDDLKADAGLAAFTDVAGLAKSYISTKAMVGKKGVIVPGQNATDEEWGAFYKSAGQPEIDKFELKLPEGKEFNKDLVGKFKEWSHKSGLLPRQAQKILESFVGFEEEMMKTRLTNQETLKNSAIEGLKKEWGEAWGTKTAAAKRFLVEVGGQDAWDWHEKTGMGEDPTFLKLAAAAGAMMAGESGLKGDGGGKLGQTPDEIQKEINDILGNKSHPINDPRHPSHQAEQKLMEARWKRLYPPTG